MKTILIVIMMTLSATAFGANVNKSCDAYMQAAWGNAPSQVRLELGLKAIAVIAEANLTPAQESKILSNAKGIIAKNPDKQDDFERTFNFACTNDLDADEKAQLKDLLTQLESL